MAYPVEQLYQRTVFVDANAILYHLQGMSPLVKDIFALAEAGRLKLVSTTRVVDEVFHKALLLRAREQFGFESKAIQKLRKDKTKIQQLAGDLRLVEKLLRVIRLQVEPINYADLRKLPEAMEKYGVFGNDALILIAMNKYNLKYLLSSDSDFESVGWISLIEVAV